MLMVIRQLDEEFTLFLGSGAGTLRLGGVQLGNPPAQMATFPTHKALPLCSATSTDRSPPNPIVIIP
jgi:hypothetical protein